MFRLLHSPHKNSCGSLLGSTSPQFHLVPLIGDLYSPPPNLQGTQLTSSGSACRPMTIPFQISHCRYKCIDKIQCWIQTLCYSNIQCCLHLRFLLGSVFSRCVTRFCFFVFSWQQSITGNSTEFKSVSQHSFWFCTTPHT